MVSFVFFLKFLFFSSRDHTAAATIPWTLVQVLSRAKAANSHRESSWESFLWRNCQWKFSNAWQVRSNLTTSLLISRLVSNAQVKSLSKLNIWHHILLNILGWIQYNYWIELNSMQTWRTLFLQYLTFLSSRFHVSSPAGQTLACMPLYVHLWFILFFKAVATYSFVSFHSQTIDWFSFLADPTCKKFDAFLATLYLLFVK